jgi:uncharacterized protein
MVSVKQQVQKKTKRLKGFFYDSPVQGLEYKTQTISGITNEKGGFEYGQGETVTFSIGGMVLGSAPGSDRVTPADLVIEVGGEVKKIRNQKVTNIARFLQSLDKDGDIENGIIITDETRNVVTKYKYFINFDQKEEAFSTDPNVEALFTKLKMKLRTATQARNHLRRSLNGIRKMTDIKIPMRDGSYLMADVYYPVDEGKYPVVMSAGAYGKAFWLGCICNEKDALDREDLEDGYFEGYRTSFKPPMGPTIDHHQPSENFELANTLDWVPHGYVVIRVDCRGVGKNPGLYAQFSLQEAQDYYDAIEWAAKQQWSNGNVGLYGASYYAMLQYNVAQLQPPSLKAMIPIGGDIDSYRDYIFTGGGLYNTFNFIPRIVCGEWKGVDWINTAMQHPFDDPSVYGPAGSLCISPDISKITVPFWSEMNTEGLVHTRGSSEAYIFAASKHKKLTMLSEPGVHFQMYSKDFHTEHITFFDYWLKGIKNGIMDTPPVKVMIRTGWNSYYWLYENEWPISSTQYTRYYLDAALSTWLGDGKRADFMKLSQAKPSGEQKNSYSADVNWGVDPCWSYGISFVTDPLSEDIIIAGYLKLCLWVSSTSHDMEIHGSVRVIDENNMEVPYTVGHPAAKKYFPVGQGSLKVSHRKLDIKKSTVYRPYHTHAKTDYQPLNPGEIVEVEVEIWPTTALIRKGHRIRLDVQPASGCGIQHRICDTIDTTYQKGSSNTIYTGPEHQSYLQIPVIPSR